MPRNKTGIISAVLLILSLLINVGLTIYNTRILLQNNQLRNEVFNENKNEFELLSPDIAWLEVDEFLEKQKTFTISYSDIKPKVQETLTKDVTGYYGFYFEDLVTGAWLGINEREEFVPVSLLKVPLMIAVLKKIEQNSLSLTDEIEILPTDIDLTWGDLADKLGQKFTIKALLQYMIQESDNTAFKALSRLLTTDEFNEALLAVGLPADTERAVTPKIYGNILRSMYLSSYLRRPMSEVALNIMLYTKYNSQIPAGVPSNIPIAHKVGFYFQQGYFHDCGIVYVPKKPYVLCIMSKDSDKVEADRVISTVSKIVYDYVTTGNFTK
jgi:beta-lactamase class A